MSRNRVILNLKNISSMRVGGSAEVFEISEISDLREIFELNKKLKKKIFVIGEGTNSYFGRNSDKYLFVRPNFRGINFSEKKNFVEVEVCSSENWDDLVQKSVEKNLWGLENLSFIPGSVGAAPVQNIGAYGQELKNVFISCEAYDFKTGKMVVLNKKDCRFAYRDSVFKKFPGRYLIISVKLKLSKIPKPILKYKPLDIFLHANPEVLQIRNLVIKTRREKLPDYKIYPNCGSFFKNLIVSDSKLKTLKKKIPNLTFFREGKQNKIPTAFILDKILHLNGFQIGDFGLWPRQPLVVVNYGKGDLLELQKLIFWVKEKVFEVTKLELGQEVNFVD